MRGQRPAQPPAASNQRRAKLWSSLAIDQELGERAALGGAPELSDPVGRSKSGSLRTWSSSAWGSWPERAKR
jgi:hypothetical protein